MTLRKDIVYYFFHSKQLERELLEKKKLIISKFNACSDLTIFHAFASAHICDYKYIDKIIENI